MKAFSLRISLLLLSGCQPESTPTAYVEPVSGKTEEMLRTELSGWETHQFKAAPEGFLTLAKSGKPVVSVLRAGSGQDVSVHGEGPEVLATLRTEKNGAHLREIEFSADGTLHRVHKQDGKWIVSTYGR